MKSLLVVLALSAAAAAAPLKCADGAPPRLTGNVFLPATCSALAMPTAELPVSPAKPKEAVLKGLDGVYEGAAMGRYEIRVEIKNGWFGRTEAALKMLQLQFHSLSTSSVKLTPAKAPGRFDIVLSADEAPGARLQGEAQAGTVDVSTTEPHGAMTEGRQLDVQFSNGARYRVRLAPSGGDAYRAQVWWAVPGTPARAFETELKRTADKP